jgi:glycosyltransferase involved in cell wall biosynthesis
MMPLKGRCAEKMRIGVAIEDTWAFFKEIFDELCEHHSVTLFQRRTIQSPIFYDRINQSVYDHDLRSFMRNNQVVFFEWASGLLESASQLPKTCGIVTRLHRYEMYRWADNIRWDVVDKIILVSQAKRGEFIQRFPAQAEKIVVIPEAISLERFALPPKPFNGDLGILCHLTPRKRVYELILAFYELNKIRGDYRLHIGGGEHPLFRDYFRALHGLVEKLGLQERVIFYGRVEQPETWYGNIDIFISNSYSEGLQVSPMEAIASGRYCLSHYWEGADELLPVDSLYLTEQELIRRILDYSDLSQTQRLEKIAAQQALVRERFDIHKVKGEIRRLVEQVGEFYTDRS